jgi:hypothetical protein
MQETVHDRYNIHVSIKHSVKATRFMRNRYEYFIHYGFADVPYKVYADRNCLI